MASDRKVRFRAGIPAVVHYRGRDYTCTAHDLSRTGVMLLGGIPWPADEIVQFRLDTPNGDLYVELSGRVARVSADQLPAPERDAVQLAVGRVGHQGAPRAFGLRKPQVGEQALALHRGGDLEPEQVEDAGREVEQLGATVKALNW